MSRYAFAIDVSRCDGCGSCFIACKDEYVGNDHLPFSAAQPPFGHKWLRLNEVEQGSEMKVKVDYITLMCQHCQDPPCAKGTPEGAVTVREDGIVILDSMKAAGCKEILSKCPYDAIFWNAEKQIPQKCNMCVHMLENGEKTTRCAESCPTKALLFGDLDNPESEISKYVAERGDFTSFHPEFDTKPSVQYRELPAPFVTGEVLLSDAADACAEGIQVTCIDAQGIRRQTVTDFLGDFQFKGLTKAGQYKITIAHPGYQTVETELITHTAKDLGTMILERKST